MKVCGIYAITNIKNNNIYIGKSIDIFQRWEQHLDGARLKKYNYDFYKDLIEISSFTFQILEICEENQLQEKEQFYIDKYNSLSNGYNQVKAIDITKQESLMLQKNILKAINLLENTNLFYKDIAEQTNLSINTIYNINICKSYTKYHNYKHNIREECGRKRYYDKGELNPRSKLTDSQVKEIIDLLKNTNLTFKQIGEKYNVSHSAINNINRCKRWTHLTKGFNHNIRKEYKEQQHSYANTIS